MWCIITNHDKDLFESYRILHFDVVYGMSLNTALQQIYAVFAGAMLSATGHEYDYMHVNMVLTWACSSYSVLRV